MGLDDKIRNTSQKAQGVAKEEAARATDNDELEAEGKRDQAAADLKQAGEHVNDVVE